MSMTVKRFKDDITPRYVQHRIADIRGGVSVKASELGGDFLPEGAILTTPDADGICHVVKIAVVASDVAATEKKIKVKKFHNLKVGDFITSAPGGKAYAITDVDATGKNYDVVSVGTAIGEVKAGGFIVEAKAESASASELKYEPKAVNGTGKTFDQKSNIDTDAWLIAVTNGLSLPEFISEKLTGIINY